MAKSQGSSSSLSDDGFGYSEWFRPVSTRLDGPQSLRQAQAELLYENYCYGRLDRLDSDSNEPPSVSPISPPSLKLLSLEAFRKAEFITEWLSANDRCLTEDPFCLDSFKFFKRAELLLQMSAPELLTLLSAKYGCNFY